MTQRTRPDEATQILFYLTETRVLPETYVGMGSSEIGAHCGPCHKPAEIFARSRSRQEWDAIVGRMTVAAPDRVPALQHDLIVDALVAAQSRAAVR